MPKQKTSPKKSKKIKDKTGRKSHPASSGMKFEIFALCAIAVCAYLLVCMYSNAGGFIGTWIKKIMMGLTGTCAYILPFATSALLIYSLLNRSGKSLRLKYILAYGLLASLGTFIQLVSVPDLAPADWFSIGAEGIASGGFIGGLILKVLSIFGTAGSYIIVICAMVVLVIMLFNISIVKVFSSLKALLTEFFKKLRGEVGKVAPAPKGVLVAPELEDDEEIVINVPKETEEPIFDEAFVDPEIKIYDDVTSGSEDEEPSEEEKEAKKLSDDELQALDREIKEEIEGADNGNTLIPYTFPSVDLLSKPVPATSGEDVQEELRNNARQLIETLHSFKVEAKVVEISQGPTITRYEIEPAEGIRVNQITNLSQDIGLRFKAEKGVMVAPVPGKSTIGIEIENKTPNTVTLREVLETEEFKNHKSKLAVALGKDVSGKPIIMDLAKMPHLLIAGATGAGKSVCINTLLISLLYKADPNEVKLVMIDPKQVELGVYNGIPHLLIPVVKDAKKATGALSWAVQEMTERYSVFERNNVRNIKGYNDLMEKNGTPENKMASIVIVIDEFADLMMVAPADVENYVCRIAQLARAAGMHLVIATQRPVVKFITGNIKANVPSRISFMVASVRDSQTILDMGGAEKLIGKGDMLYMPVGETSPSRMQCAFVSDEEVNAVVSAITQDTQAVYDPNVIEQIEKDEGEYKPDGEDPGDCDELLADCIDMAITSGQISTSLLQRRFRIGYNRAGSIIDQMEARGIISGLDGNKPRQVLITREEYNEMLMKQ